MRRQITGFAHPFGSEGGMVFIIWDIEDNDIDLHPVAGDVHLKQVLNVDVYQHFKDYKEVDFTLVYQEPSIILFKANNTYLGLTFKPVNITDIWYNIC